MSVQTRMVNEADQEDKWLYRVGGISALVIGLGYIIIIALFVPIGAEPSGVEARLAYLAANSALWWAILALSVLTDLLFIPVALSLNLALKGIHRNAMLLATSCVGLFVVLDLALTWTNYAVLIALSADYAAASDAQRAVLVTAAYYPAAMLESNLLFVYNTLTLSVGILLVGLIMFKGSFGKSIAYLSLVTGILGIAAVAGSFFMSTVVITIIASVMTTAWVLFAGYRLYKLGQ